MTSAAARKYAQALLEVAVPEKLEDQVLEDLGSFGELLEGSSELTEVLASPAIPIAVKREVLKQLATRLSLAPIVTNFILVLLQNARLPQFDECLEAYQQALDASHGVLRGALDPRLSRPPPTVAAKRFTTFSRPPPMVA